jgi:DNA-binding transcriptional LysR family regulator
MDLAALSLFVDVAHRGSFAATAKEHDLDPSSVSRIVAQLEADLGVRLFQRTTRRMTLTEAGDLYLARIEPLMDELRRAGDIAQNVSAGPSGTIRITASVTFGIRRLVPLLGLFRERYPALKVDALFTDANVDLVAERIDLAVRLGATVEGDLIATKLVDTRYRVVASPHYLETAPPLNVPSDLLAHRCILLNLRAFRTRWRFRDAKGVISEVPVDGDITLSAAIALYDAALAGLGPTLLPDWLVDGAIRDGLLLNPFPTHAVTATTFDTGAWLIYQSRSYLPGKVRVMIDFLKEQIVKTNFTMD